LQPEIEELRTAFSKLKKLSVCGIFVEFDILWTTAFLVAAPSIEKLRIQVMPLSVFIPFSPHLEIQLLKKNSRKMLNLFQLHNWSHKYRYRIIHARLVLEVACTVTE
jgi:hypothetical protein